VRRAVAAAAAVLLTAGAALAEGGSTTRDGKTLSVSKAVDLRPEGEQVVVRGSGYDESKGIYVAFCVDNGPGQVPTPCGGGADTEGSSGNSVWISSFPPAYGSGLARPYGDGGSFEVQISVRAQLNEEVDCRQVRCAVVTRNDHTRSEDRSQDLLVPIRFAAPAQPSASRPPAPRASSPAPTGTVSATTKASGAATPAAVAGSSPEAAPTTSPAASTSPTDAPEPAADHAPALVSSGDLTAPGPTPTSSDAPTPLLLVAAAALGTAGLGGLLWRRRVRR
jgi:hypothetical protein